MAFTFQMAMDKIVDFKGSESDFEVISDFYKQQATADGIAKVFVDDVIKNQLTSKHFTNNGVKGFQCFNDDETILKGMIFVYSDGEIKHLMVDNRWRRQGVGTKLLNECMRNFSHLYLSCLGTNESARKFYSGCMFLDQIENRVSSRDGVSYQLYHFTTTPNDRLDDK